MTVLNETKNLYQYFDAITQAEYLYECVAETIEKDLREEIGFIQKYDRALDETKEVVDMPDKRALLLVRLIMQNKGKLAKNKRDMFSEVTDEEREPSRRWNETMTCQIRSFFALCPT
jgi:hypothetical protein